MSEQVENAYDALEQALEVIVNEPGKTWQEKRDAFVHWANASGGSVIGEFVSWVQGVELD